jgi:WD40 repeat protein
LRPAAPSPAPPRDRGAAFALDAVVVAAVWAGPAAVGLALGDGTVRWVARGAGGGWTVAGATRAHEGAVLCAAPHPDGRSVLTGGDDGAVARAAPGDAEAARLAALGRAWVQDLAASPASGVVAAAAGREACVLDPRTGAVAHRFAHPATVAALALDPKGRRLAAAHYGGVTLRWALAPEAAPRVLAWKGSHVAVSWGPDGRFLVTAMQEGELHGWRVGDGEPMRMRGYAAKPRSMSWTPRGRHLLTSGADRVVAWPFAGRDGPMGRRPAELGDFAALVTRVAAHPRQEVHAAGCADGSVHLARLADGADIPVAPAGGGRVTALAWSPDGAALAWGAEDGRAGVFSPAPSG